MQQKLNKITNNVDKKYVSRYTLVKLLMCDDSLATINIKAILESRPSVIGAVLKSRIFIFKENL